MRDVIVVEYYDTEESVRCRQWAEKKKGLDVAEHWIACCFAGIGAVGFAESLGDIERTQIFCTLMGFGFIWLLMQHIWRTSKTVSQMKRQEYELQGIRMILCERGIVSNTGRRSWQGIKLVIWKGELSIAEFHTSLPSHSKDRIVRGTDFANSYMDARGKESGSKGREARRSIRYLLGRSQEDVLPGFSQYGIPGPCTELFAGVGTYCVGFVLQDIRYVLECTSGC